MFIFVHLESSVVAYNLLLFSLAHFLLPSFIVHFILIVPTAEMAPSIIYLTLKAILTFLVKIVNFVGHLMMLKVTSGNFPL